MEEEQHRHHHQYGGGGGGSNSNANHMADLRQFFSPIPTHHFPAPPAAHHSLFSSASGAFTPLPHHYDSVMLVTGGRDHVLQATGGGIQDFRPDSTTTSTATATAPAGMTPTNSGAAPGFDMEAGWGGSGASTAGFGLGVGGGDVGATARWPRQETLTLLEIRSRLDHKFKEANHKGPLWDEVSRIMSEEHGYQRSGKKCREKFENLYKYYKKTKEGKAGRQDGKHYRFFRQLEALYGEASHNHHISSSEHTHLNMIGNSNTTTPPLQFHNTINTNGQQEGFNSISLSNSSSDFDTSSSEGNEIDRVGGSMENGESSMDMMMRSRRRRGRSSWKAKIKDFIDSQMRKIIEKQEAWLEKMMRTLEHKEQERMSREEDWRKQEAQRMEREHKFWAEERAWIEARDKALMNALHRITGKEMAVMENDLSSDHTEELLMAARHHQKQQQSQEEDDDEEEEEEEDNNGDVNDDQTVGNGESWAESEIAKLIELRTSMQTRFEQCSGSKEDNLWEEISTRLSCLGYDRSAIMCEEKWDSINKAVAENRDSNNSKKRKENWKTRSIDCNSSHHQVHQHLQTTQTNNLYSYGEISSQGGMGLAPPEIGLGGGGGGNPAMNDSCLRILLGDGGESHLWESYGIKLNKGETH